MTTTTQDLITEIKEIHRKRTDFHKSEKSMTLRIRAVCFRLVSPSINSGAFKTDDAYLKAVRNEADRLYKALDSLDHPQASYAAEHVDPMRQARRVLEAERKAAEKQCERLAKQLPVWGWVESVRGVGPLSLAQIVGEAGDLDNYPNPAKLWKRMGLAVINGERQRKVSGAEALQHGYSPQRRSTVWSIGDCMIRAGGPYADMYRARKQIEETKIPDSSKAHWHNRAKRYMEKKFLRDLWRVWHQQS